MALLDPNHDSNHSVALLSFARSVFDSSFALGSDRSLDHYLARDYARHTIQAALLHNRDLLNSAEREQITLPLASNHVDAWGQEVDRDRENYREGNAPVHMDFENYTLGRLVRNRRNYDMEHEGHSWLREKLFWRIYDLGYSLDSFGDIDATIARSRWYPTDEPERTDRYGKKYSWIAFWELATHQMDRGLLDDLQEQYSRMSDVDIDPSFPRPAQEREGMKIDLIGDSSTSTEQWIVEGPIPDVRSIDRDEGGDMGPGAWRLIWGCAYQEDLALKRRAFLNYRTYFTRNPLTEEQLKGLNASTQWGANFPDAPADLYTFAGEMPWCETFPYNDWTTLAWEVGRETVEVPELAGLLVGHETNQTSDLTMVEQIVWAEADVLPTARTNQWESYHSTIVSDRSIDVPCRQLCDFARLHGRPQTYDFFDQNGERASSVVRWGDRWKNGGTATYVREDILERFIESNGFALLTLLTGDRSFHADDDHERTAFGAEAQYVQNYVRVWTEAS